MKAQLDALAGFAWGSLLLIPLLLATGLYLTVVLARCSFTGSATRCGSR